MIIDPLEHSIYYDEKTDVVTIHTTTQRVRFNRKDRAIIGSFFEEEKHDEACSILEDQGVNDPHQLYNLLIVAMIQSGDL